MTLNTLLIDADGRECRLITMPIPGRKERLAVVLYDDGHGALVDLAECKEQVAQEATP